MVLWIKWGIFPLCILSDVQNSHLQTLFHEGRPFDTDLEGPVVKPMEFEITSQATIVNQHSRHHICGFDFGGKVPIGPSTGEHATAKESSDTLSLNRFFQSHFSREAKKRKTMDGASVEEEEEEEEELMETRVSIY